MKLCTVLPIVFVVALVLVLSQNSYACSCEIQLPKRSVKKQVKEARKYSQAVFAGEVLEIAESSDKSFLSVKVGVESNWKGADANVVVIVTGKGNGDCGYPFAVGRKYLIYAYQTSNGQLSTNICQRTALFSDAERDIMALGKPKQKRSHRST